MSEMSDKEKLFIFMAHADDLQKIADASHKELQAVTAAVKDLVKRLPGEVTESVAGRVSKIANSRLVGPVEQAGAELGQIVGNVKSATKGLWRYPAAILTFFMVAMGGIAYLGVQWLKDERYELKAEISALNHDLAQTANVRKFTAEDGEDQFWVEIDLVKKTGDKDGKAWARMPRR